MMLRLTAKTLALLGDGQASLATLPADDEDWYLNLIWVDGRKCLFLGRRPYAWIVGMEVAESEKLLDELWAHASKPEFAWGHSWQIGDVLIWNNLSVLHRRDPFDPNQRRRMHRTQIKGREVIG